LFRFLEVGSVAGEPAEPLSAPRAREVGLVLASGYYYPTLRLDVVALSAPAIPVVGDVMGHTLSPIISRLMWPIMTAKIFGPKSAPAKFEQFP
jgi:hypothetical protein